MSNSHEMVSVAAEVATFLRLLGSSSDVFEIRVPNYRQGNFTSTLRGYYQHLMIDSAAKAIAALDASGQAPVIYVTLNRLNPTLLARCANRVIPKAKETAADKDVIRRLWLLIDCDPVRPAGVSSTEAELELARQRSAQVRAALTRAGWPDPIELMSGNGHHLLYRIDLPGNDDGLVQRVLASVAERFDDETVKIDRSVHNAARITKVAGTIAANKGDDFVGVEGFEDRPHRRARLLSAPDAMTPVSREQLEAIAGQAPDMPLPPGRRARTVPGERTSYEKFERSPAGVRAYLERHGVPVKGERRNGTATYLYLDRCPVVADCQSGNGTDIAVIVNDEGLIAYKNWHDRGTGVEWVDVRESLEPGYRAYSASRNAADTDRAAKVAQCRPRTDLGNAERLVDLAGRDLRYCHASGRWYVWNGKVWSPDGSGAVMRHAGKTARSIYKEASRARDTADAAALGTWARASESRNRLDAMVALARSQPGIAVQPAHLNADGWALNCLNGTLDLRTGTLHPHRREDLNTKIVPVAFDPAATAPLWMRFLDRVFAGDAALIRFVQQSLGICLTGDITAQFLWIFYGEGNNGKNVLLDTVTGIMADYAGQAPPELLVSSKQREHPTEIADLCGRRLVLASETEENAPLRLQLIKRLTGDATLKGRFMRQDYFEFARTHKLVLLTNNLPTVNEDGEAAWRRLRVVPFLVVIPPEERDPRLLEKLKAEWPGILAWLVRGCLDWRANGLVEPPSVTVATASYRGASDHIGRFLSECCNLGAGLWTPSSDLLKQYVRWCTEQSETPLASKVLAARLRRHGCKSEKSAGQRGWVGVEIKP